MSSTTTIEFSDETYDYKTLSLEEFLAQNTPSGWKKFFSLPSIQKIIPFLSENLKTSGETEIIYPSMNNIFRALYETKEDDVSVVILGQDPYHNGSAVGLAFSVPEGVKLNPSIVNIKKEVVNCGFDVDPKSGNLLSWSQQGVLLINTALTVKKGEEESHLKIWRDFTEEFIKYLTEEKDALVFILWGNKAKSYKKHFTKEHFIVETSHPSPLSASKGFLGSECFSEANGYLLSLGKDEIDWSIL